MLNLFKFFHTNIKRDPHDTLNYNIPKQAIIYTERVLQGYASMNPPNEGLVYWGGRKNGDSITVSIVIAPQTNSNWGRVATSNRSNFDFVRTLNRRGLTQIAQVHSHPTDWVDHSPGDDLYAAFKREGLLSIVVPEYCANGMPSLTVCGCHRYANKSFIRLSVAYVKSHFHIVNRNDCLFEDQRI